MSRTEREYALARKYKSCCACKNVNSDECNPDNSGYTCQDEYGECGDDKEFTPMTLEEYLGFEYRYDDMS